MRSTTPAGRWREPTDPQVELRLASTRTIEAFVDDALNAFDTAFSRVEGAAEHDLRVAGRHVRIRVAAPELDRRFLPAPAHPVNDFHDGEPDPVISCWAGAVSGL